ncbi:MAG TPA: IS256 family transposase [Solirubrobacteraceae bacterium]|nr:IS256 family transposase [Solirubrobacteraceae bacterium]
MLEGVDREADAVEAVGRLGARLILQQALEDEVTDFLGRARYERRGEPISHRNGYERRTVKTTSGPVELERPRVRDAQALGFESKLLGKGVARTHALESLVICSFLRGLSVRDVEAALQETFDEPVIGKSTVARVCRDTAERYRQWCARRLEAHDLVYLFLDAIYLKLRPSDEPAEGVLVAWGVTLEGQKVLLGLALGSRESYEAWLAFGRDLIDRGLRAPALVVADGAPGLWKAARECWPQAAEQRCTVHALRQLTAKLPERHHSEVKARWWAIFDAAASPAEAKRELLALAGDYRGAYPSTAAVIERDVDPLVAHLRFPSEHRKRIRSTNLLERTFVEVRRRTKVIGRFPGETSALSLIWAVLELSSRGWRGVVMTPRIVAEIERLRRGGDVPDVVEHGVEVAA